MVLMNRAVRFGYWLTAHNVQGNQLLIPIVLLNSDAVYLLSSCILPRGVSSRGAAMIRLEMSYIRDVLLFCSSRVHNRGADVIGRYGFYVKTVLLILFEGFTSILTFVGFSPSRNYCLAIVQEIYTGIQIERFGIRIAVLRWQFLRLEFGIAVLPWQ